MVATIACHHMAMVAMDATRTQCLLTATNRLTMQHLNHMITCLMAAIKCLAMATGTIERECVSINVCALKTELVTFC